MTRDDPDARIESVLAAHFDDYAVGDRLHAVPPHVVHAVTVDGRRAVCKLAVGPAAHLRRDARVLEHARGETSLPVPEVLASGDDHLVADWLDEVPGEAGDHDLDGWARAAGAGLATLHAETGFDHQGPLRARDGDLAVDARETAALGLAGYLADLRPGVVDTGYADVLDDAIEVLEDHPSALAGAGDPVCCHGTWLPEHVGVRDGEVRAVIDFERAVAAPAEHDYWRTAIPLFAGPEPDTAAREAFREGYESVRALPADFEERAPVHRLVVAASFVESLFVQDKHPPGKTREKADWLRARVDALVEECSEQLG